MAEPSHRRRFLRTIGVGTVLAPSFGVPPACGDEPKPEEKPPEKPKEKHDDRPSEAEARMELILARFGDRLDDEARKSIRSEVEAMVRRAEELRKLPLDNGEGPFPVFTPFRRPLA